MAVSKIASIYCSTLEIAKRTAQQQTAVLVAGAGQFYSCSLCNINISRSWPRGPSCRGPMPSQPPTHDKHPCDHSIEAAHEQYRLCDMCIHNTYDASTNILPAHNDTEGIRTLAGRAQSISSPCPYPLGHNVLNTKLKLCDVLGICRDSSVARASD